MSNAHHRLAAWLGGGGTRQRDTPPRPTLNRPGPPAPWYPPTMPGAVTAELAAIRSAATPAQAEVAHEEDYLAARRQLPLTAILAAWRSSMMHMLDTEWLAWRDLLHTYPAPEEGQ